MKRYDADGESPRSTLAVSEFMTGENSHSNRLNRRDVQRDLLRDPAETEGL